MRRFVLLLVLIVLYGCGSADAGNWVSGELVTATKLNSEFDAKVSKTGDETIAGEKVFTGSIEVVGLTVTENATVEKLFVNMFIGDAMDDGESRIQVNGSVSSTQYRLSALNSAPASAAATGTLGEVRITADHIYVCIATNTWVRAALATW